jgi:DNA-binding SARP family transcriptional activator
MAKLSLTLLGGFHARLDPGPAFALPTRKAQALLTYLARPIGQVHPRGKLAALLWGGIREESARASLRQALFSIRRALSEHHGVLRQEGDALGLDPAGAEVDATVFEDAVAEGTPKALALAASLYQGDLLSGFALTEPPFEEWLIGERERLRELALEGLAKLLVQQRRGGETEVAVQTALRLLTLDPLQEPVHRALMRLYAALGRRGAALRQYQHCVSVLGRELGIEPEAETKALYQDILRQRLPLLTVERPGGSEARPTVKLATVDVGAETRLIGRDAELEQLRAELESARGGAGRVVAVIGEAGIGKSRLVSELAVNAARYDVTVLVGRSFQSEQILPFGPWVDAMRAGRVTDDRELLARLGSTLRSELARILPEVDDGPAPGTGATDARLIFESVTRLIDSLAARQPVLVVLEDLHWADEMSARLLAFVGRRLVGRPVIVVLTAREEEIIDTPALGQAITDLQREGCVTTLTLRPLSRSDTLDLVRELARVGDAAALDRLGEHAWAASEGNPFVAVETVRAHVEHAWIAQGGDLGLPERVRDIVGGRLERLSETGQTLTAVAAVIGREFEFALLQRAAGLSEEETAGGVEELVRRRVLHGVGERFDFTHDWIREVAAARILAPRRKLIHRRVAEAIETRYATDLRAHELSLGLHYRSAEVWDQAAEQLFKAGCAAGKERAANREAVACFDASLQCLRSLPEDRERSERVIDTIIEQEASLMGLGEFRRSLTGLREAEVLARGLGDRIRLGWILGRFAYNLGSMGELAGAIENAEQARLIGIETGDTRAHVSSNVMLARAYYARGDYRQVMEAVRENDLIDRRLVLEGHARGNITFSRIWGILALAELGEFPEAIAVGEDTLKTAAVQDGRHSDVWAHLGVGRLYLVKGNIARAIEVLERVLPRCEAAGDLAVYFSRTATWLGGAYILAGRLEEAIPLLRRADEHAGSIGFAYGHALVIVTLAEATLRAGDVENAARAAERALAMSRRHGQRGWEAWTLRLQGEVAMGCDPQDVERAEASFRAAGALGQELAMRPLRAHCRLGLGVVYRRAGKRDRAREEIDAALAEYRAMDMPYWLARAEAEGGTRLGT